jgi:hypothetical protein
MPEYANVNGWSIRIDTSLANGCFAFLSYEQDSVLRIGIDATDNSAYVIFGNANWESISIGKKYDVEIQFGSEVKWVGTGNGFSFDPPEDQPYLWVEIENNPESTYTFISEFMQEKNVQLFYNGQSIENLSLKSSYSAGMKLLECQKEMNKKGSDPFSQPTRDSDPFAV